MKIKILVTFLIGFLLTTTPSILGVEESDYDNQSIEEKSIFIDTDFLFEEDFYNESTGNLISLRPENETERFPYYVPGELIVKFKDNIDLESSELLSKESIGISSFLNKEEKGSIGLSSQSSEELISFNFDSIIGLILENNVISIKELFPDTIISSLSNVFKLTFPVDTDIISVMRDYNSDDIVVYAEPNYLYTTSFAQKKILRKIPTDPMFSQQWALDQISDCDIDAPEAWDIETGSSDVTIAIIDTGVDYNHEDLSANIWHDPISGNPGYDFVDIDTQMYLDYGFRLCPDEDYTVPDSDPLDVFGHGTHCAGIAGAVSNNSLGVAGVGWNCKVMPVRAGFKLLAKGWFGNWFETALLELDDVAYSIVYATDKDADVISMSYGGYFNSNLEKDVINYAYSNDVILVGAAGNENTNLEHYPSAHENVLAVAATNSTDERAYFSNHGSWVDVAAPGVNILSLRANDTDMYGDGTYIVNEDYYIASGTSMACPHVAGLAGLLISKNSQCPSPAHMARSMIPFTADEIQVDEEIGGRVNAFNLLNHKAFAAKLDLITYWEDVKGTFDIRGAAWGEDFQEFILEDGFGEEPSSWTELFASSIPQDGVLLSLDTTLLAEGLHTIRLRVVCSHGTYADKILIFVNNEADNGISADIYVSNCFDSSTPGWSITKFDNIQDGVDHAKYGDTVFVYDGIYENVSWSVKSIKLVGQSNDFTIIEGGICLKYMKNTIVKNFKIRGFTTFYALNKLIYLGALLLIGSSDCVIKQNNILIKDTNGVFNFYAAISLSLSSHNVIKDNIIKGLPYPIPAWVVNFGILVSGSSDVTISDNEIYNFQKGMCILGVLNSVIENNKVIGDGDFGMIFGFIGKISIKNNYIYYDYPLELNFAYLNEIVKNRFYGMGSQHHLLFIYESSFNKLIANEIRSNDSTVAVFLTKMLENSSSKYNKIYYNNFINSWAKDCYGINSTNTWYKEKLFGKDMGNYHSKYEYWYRKEFKKDPKDNNNDGIWDVPMSLKGGEYHNTIDNVDKYPMVDPFDLENINIEEIGINMEMSSEELLLFEQIEEAFDRQISLINQGLVVIEEQLESKGSSCTAS